MKWIKTIDQLPDPSKTILICDDEGNIAPAKWCSKVNEFNWFDIDNSDELCKHLCYFMHKDQVEKWIYIDDVLK